jgi:hypothetical protein
MTDVLAPVLVPYARFLEIRARRFDSVTEPNRRDRQDPTTVSVASEPISDRDGARVDVRVLAADPEPGVQRS